jgi:hypothetical protein
MSRKDYQEFARILHSILDMLRGPEAIIAVNLLTAELCEVFEDDNPNFDRKRFLAAINGTNQAN